MRRSWAVVAYEHIQAPLQQYSKVVPDRKDAGARVRRLLCHNRGTACEIHPERVLVRVAGANPPLLLPISRLSPKSGWFISERHTSLVVVVLLFTMFASSLSSAHVDIGFGTVLEAEAATTGACLSGEALHWRSCTVVYITNSSDQSDVKTIQPFAVCLNKRHKFCEDHDCHRQMFIAAHNT